MSEPKKEPAELRNLWRGLGRSHRLFDQEFGNVVALDEVEIKLEDPSSDASECSAFKPLTCKRRTPRQRTGFSLVSIDKVYFNVLLDVRDFKIQELEVQIEDSKHTIVVTARHPERRDCHHGSIMREFIRHYLVPHNLDLSMVRCSYTRERMLRIRGRAMVKKPNLTRIVPIVEELEEPPQRPGAQSDDNQERKSEEEPTPEQGQPQQPVDQGDDKQERESEEEPTPEQGQPQQPVDQGDDNQERKSEDKPTPEQGQPQQPVDQSDDNQERKSEDKPTPEQGQPQQPVDQGDDNQERKSEDKPTPEQGQPQQPVDQGDDNQERKSEDEPKPEQGQPQQPGAQSDDNQEHKSEDEPKPEQGQPQQPVDQSDDNQESKPEDEPKPEQEK